MHILVIPSWYTSPSSTTRGIFFKKKAELMSSFGHKVGVIAPCNISIKEIARSGKFRAPRTQVLNGVVTYQDCFMSVPKLKTLNTSVWVRKCVQLAREYILAQGRPDIVHVHGAFPAGLAAIEISREIGVPYIVSEHSSAYKRNLWSKVQQKQIKRVLAGAAAVTAVSRDLAETIQAFCPDQYIEVVGNYVDCAFFARLNMRAARTSVFRFVSVCSLNKGKGVDVLLRAFAILKTEHEGVDLVVIGDGAEMTSLCRLAFELGIEDEVQFLGSKDQNGVRNQLWEGDCLVSSSYVETFGVTIVEAMAAGLPVVVTKSGGPEDFVTQETGTLVDVGDPQALSQAMAGTIDQRLIWRARSEEIAAHAERLFGPTSIHNSYLKIYRDSVR